jgi:hypothetical protein
MDILEPFIDGKGKREVRPLAAVAFRATLVFSLTGPSERGKPSIVRIILRGVMNESDD